MARIRFKIELNPGGTGIRLDKLAKITSELEKFVRQLAKDSGAEATTGEWVAKDFYNSSVGAVVEYVGLVDPAVVSRFNTGVRFFSGFQAKHADRMSRYSPETIKRFVDIGEVIDVDERVKIGLLDEEISDQVEAWVEINRSTTLAVDEIAKQSIVWRGSIQGAIGTWYKESNYFNLKDFVHGNNVRCFYPPSRYEDVHALFKNKDAVVNVEGEIKSDVATGTAREIRVSNWIEVPQLTDEEFEKLLAGSTGLTGSNSTVKYIERRRIDEER
jgi:hypothetical protein